MSPRPADVVSGKTIERAELRAVSDRGRIAFLATFTNGIDGIVVGDPKQ